MIECKGADSNSCLTAPQVEAARKLYAGPKNPRTGEQIYSPLYPGSELGWGQLTGDAPISITTDFIKYFVCKDPNWDYKTRPINFDSDVALADKPDNLPVNAIDPDIKKFAARGGKMMLWGGWNDAGVPPLEVVNYYNNVVEDHRREDCDELGAVIYGPWHGALRRRRRHRPFRSVPRSPTVGGAEAGAGRSGRFAHRER